MPTYHHAWILATNRGATAPSSTAKTGLAYEAWPGKHGLLCFALALPKRDPRLDSLRHTYIHVRRLRASRSVAACGIDGAGTRGSCGSLPASLAIYCGVDYDGVAGSCGSRPTAGILEG